MTAVDIISISSGLISILLAVYAICFAKKESAQSADNYIKTKELLKEIEHKADLIDRGIQFQQGQLTTVMNKLFDLTGKAQTDMKPLTLEEIDEIIDGKTETAQKRLDEIENVVNRLPKIHIGKEPPETLKNGDIWFQVE